MASVGSELGGSSGSSSWVRGGEKHEIYAAAFGGHLFYDLLSQGGGGGGMAPSPPAGSATGGAPNFSISLGVSEIFDELLGWHIPWSSGGSRKVRATCAPTLSPVFLYSFRQKIMLNNRLAPPSRVDSPVRGRASSGSGGARGHTPPAL